MLPLLLFRMVRWAIRIFLVLAIIFIALHHPDVRSWALANRFARPLALEILKLPSTTKLGKKDILPPRELPRSLPNKRKKSAEVRLPPVDHLTQEDQLELQRELENILDEKAEKQKVASKAATP